MTSQLGVRFFKYEKYYFSGESVEHLSLKKSLLQHIKSVTHSNATIKHKLNIQNKYVRQNKRVMHSQLVHLHHFSQ